MNIPRIISENKVAALALFCMVFQNSAHTLLIRYSRGVLHETYIPGTNVILIEITKFILCACVMAAHTPPTVKVMDLYKDTLRNSLPTFVPAFLYFIQNTLAYVALQNLDAGAFAVLVQLKTLTTAVFSVALLNRRLCMNQWRALCLLVLAAILIEAPTSCTTAVEAEAAPVHTPKNNALGVLAVLGIITTSGSAGVYFEKILKTRGGTLWERNFQLAAHSIVFGFISLFIYDGRRVLAQGFFAGYSVVSFLIVFIGAAGGILVAVVMKYANNIVKSFATAISICITSLLSIPLFDASVGTVFWVGAFMVIVSIFNYSDTPRPQSPPPLLVPSKSPKVDDDDNGTANDSERMEGFKVGEK